MRPVAPIKYGNEKICENVYRHFFLEKNPRCSQKYGNCIYGETGCAVGCLLTQKDAEKISDSGNLEDVWDKHFTLLGKYFSVGQYPLLKSLQLAHDENTDREKMLKRMLAVFKEYGFDPYEDQEDTQ